MTIFFSIFFNLKFGHVLMVSFILFNSHQTCFSFSLSNRYILMVWTSFFYFSLPLEVQHLNVLVPMTMYSTRGDPEPWLRSEKASNYSLILFRESCYWDLNPRPPGPRCRTIRSTRETSHRKSKLCFRLTIFLFKKEQEIASTLSMTRTIE